MGNGSLKKSDHSAYVGIDSTWNNSTKHLSLSPDIQKTQKTHKISQIKGYQRRSQTIKTQNSPITHTPQRSPVDGMPSNKTAISQPHGRDIGEWRMAEDYVTKRDSDIGNDKFQGDVRLSDAIKLDIRLDKSPLVQSDSPARHSMLVSIEERLFGELDIDTCKADIICIIDVSFSMQGQKLDYVKKTLVSLLDFIKGSRMAIVIFGTHADVLMNFKIVSDASLPHITRIIESITEQGNTNITAAVKVSQTLLKARCTRNDVASMLLLSDGQHNTSDISIDGMFDGDTMAAGTEYTLHAFGYGDDHDSKLMQAMSERKQGNYYFVNDIAKVNECFADCMGMITTSLANKGKMTLKLHPTAYYPEVRILKTYGPYWQKASDTEAVIQLSNIYAGMKKDFGLEIELDASKKRVFGQTQAVLATLKLEYTDMSTSARSKLEKSLTVQIYPKGFQVNVVTNLEVKKNIMRAAGGDAIKKAHEYNEQGRSKAGILLLDSLKTEFEKAQDVKDDIEIKSLIKEFDEIIKMLKNDLTGTPNMCSSTNYMMQKANVYRNQTSSPLSELTPCMYQSKRQHALVTSMKLKSTPIYLPSLTKH